MNVDEEIIKKEEASFNKSLQKKSVKPESEEIISSLDKEISKIEEETKEKIQKTIKEMVEKEFSRPRDVRLVNTPRVYVQFPEIQKVAGIKQLIEQTKDLVKAINDDSEAIHKVSGMVRAVVDFPDVQRIKGVVKADVDFPDIQKIKGEVIAKVDFPDEYKITGEVITDIPQLQLGNRKIVPVSIWDGKRFVNPFASTSVNGGGQQVSILKDILSQLRDGTLSTTASLGDVQIEGNGAILDGVDGNIKATVFDLSNSNSLATAIVDGDGNQITSFGGGVQYDNNDIDTVPTGNVMMYLDDLGRIYSVQKGRPLPISGGIHGNVTISGTTTVSGSFTPHTLTQRIVTALEAIVSGNEAQVDVVSLPNEGQQTMANSISVAIASNQSDVPITLGGETVVLGAGSASIGTLGANSGVDIGDVTINNAGGGSAVNIQDGGNSITVDGAVTIAGSVGTVTQLDLTNADPLAVAIVDASGDQISSFGGGTQYDNGDTDITPTGTVSMWLDDLGRIRSVQKGHPLPVNAGVHGNVTISGTTTVSGNYMPHTMGQNILNRLEEITISLQTIDNVVSGNEAQVDVVTMPTTTVTATNLDVRDLVFASDKVDISGSTLAANSGVDIGDVTVNNAGGASAVNIQDGGNSITVDAINLDIRDLTNADVVTAELSAVDNAVLDAMAASLAIMDDWDNGADAAKVIGQANSGVDIGDVTINNASGGAAVNIQDGGNSITIDGSVTIQGSVGIISQFDLSNSDPLAVAIVDSSGDQISSFGGGIQYSNNQVAATPTGTLTMWLDDSGVVRAAQKGRPLPIAGGINGNVTISGAVYGVTRGDIIAGSGNVPLTPIHQPINTSGIFPVATLISGLANRRVKILNGVIMAKSAVTVQLKSNNNSDLTGPMDLNAGAGYQIPEAEIGNMKTIVSQGVTVNLSNPVRIGGWLTYVYE